jgi:transcriptional regulator with XRE-family HTH domain
MPQPLAVSPAINPAINPAIKPAINPAINRAVNPVVNHVINGAVDPTVDPEVDPTVDPTVDPEVDRDVDPVLDPVDPEVVRQLTRALTCAISATIRAGRAELRVSQRELAGLTGLSQSVIARLEAGTSDPRLSCLVAVLTTVGARLSLPDRATPTRMAGEYARDEAGRRLPAHLGPYRLRESHSWWSGIMDIRRWPFEPKWSYRRRPEWPT